uniref:Uncharacterized protein n=1 Tax=Romanomermis culicivorax TaxID=13658 RepID=A0A915IBW6_ROMCU
MAMRPGGSECDEEPVLLAGEGVGDGVDDVNIIGADCCCCAGAKSVGAPTPPTPSDGVCLSVAFWTCLSEKMKQKAKFQNDKLTSLSTDGDCNYNTAKDEDEEGPGGAVAVTERAALAAIEEVVDEQHPCTELGRSFDANVELKISNFLNGVKEIRFAWSGGRLEFCGGRLGN